MTDERDPGLSERMAEFRATNEIFPLAPIENVAQITYEGLLKLRDEIDPDIPAEWHHDARMRIYLNHLYVRQKIAPIVTELMRRSDPQGVYFNRKKTWGYEYDGGEVAGQIDFTHKRGKFMDLDSPEQIQLACDTTGLPIRKRIRKFSNMTKTQILDHFIMYAEEYLDQSAIIVS